MNQLFESILTASFHGSIVILAVIVLRLLLKKTPKKFFCLQWLLAGIRLLMPFEIKSDLSLQPEPEPIVQQIVSYEYPDVIATGPVVNLPAEPAPAWQPNWEAVPEDMPAPTEVISPVETVTIHKVAPQIPWETLTPWIWITVAGLFLVYTFYSYWRLRLLVREAIRIDGGWECERIETAFILGFIRPRIYIPMGLSQMVRKHILAHERTHLEKGDHWFKMIGFIALALHWFNPLVWIAYILLCKDIEMACDERVVQFMELQERKEYSAALLNCSTNKVHFAACPVAFGEVSVKHRIKSVLKYKKPSFWISLLGVVAILFVAVCLVTSPVGHESDLPNTETARAQIHVTVRNVDEFLDAIAPDTRIILEPGTYNLTEASGYAQKTNSEFYSWSEMGDGHQLILHGLENLTIQGSGRMVTNLSTDPRYANVLVLQNCNNLRLTDFTAGHTDGMGECSGGVLNLENCTDITLDGLGLYGCGTVGLRTDLCSGVILTDSDIYDCSSSAVVLGTSKDITISGCRIYDIGHDEYGGYTFFEMSSSQFVTIEKCEFSTSVLQHLLWSSGTQVDLHNNLFVGNRFQDSAFYINGQLVTLDGNKFDGNTIRTWYSGYGNVALDANGDPLTEAKLEELYPSEPKQPSQPQLEIHVNTVDELLAAIGPNKDIVLEGELYDFSTATGYGTSSGDYYYWEDVYDGPGLVIRDVDNMTIRSIDGNVNNHTIAAIPRYADVLAFKACSNITLSGFTAGHTKEPGSCAGGVIEFRDCDNMQVDNCGLYGCGILGVYAEYSKNIHVTNCEIYECSQGGVQMRNTDSITLSGNTFRDLGGDETSFISCSNINLEGQLLNPKDELDSHISPATEPVGVADEEDLANLGHAVTSFAEGLFNGNSATMKLHLSADYDLPIMIDEELVQIGATPAAIQDLPADYANEMEAKGYCDLTLAYVTNENEYGLLKLEMCRENGIWKVQYYTLDDTEIALLDKVLWNFVWAYFQQDLETMEFLLSDSYTGTVETYFGNWGDVEWEDDNIVNIDHTFSNADIAGLDSYSIAVPFKANKDSEEYTYLNIALQRRTQKKQYEDGRIDSEWEVVDYGIDNTAPSTTAAMDLPGGVQVETIEGENYTGVAMLIDDPARVFLGTSTGGEDFSTSIPGKRIGEMFEGYPGTVAAVNAGAFFDDGTASAAVGSYPLGLTISQGEQVWSQAQGISPGMEGFAGFNAKNELVVVDHNLTPEEAVALDIRDGVSMGPALIIDRELQPGGLEEHGHNPRTAIGQREDGTVILLCINGRVFNSLGATYADVANEMMRLGAESACLMQGGSATSMAYCDSGSGVHMLTSVRSMDGSQELQPRRLPTYWMVAGK